MTVLKAAEISKEIRAAAPSSSQKREDHHEF